MTPISQTPTGAAREAAGTLPAPRAATRAGGVNEAQERSRIDIVGVTKRFVSPTGTAMTALRDVSFSVEPGQFCAVVGPTGCGKSTTLTMVAGLERPSAGVVRVGDGGGLGDGCFSHG